ncbi:MAG: FAD-dependent oxidoreductase [Chitinophagales bacterium]
MILLSPLRIGTLEVKNRIVMSALGLVYADNGMVTERLIRFYEERGRGGAGLIILGACHVDEHSYPFQPSIHDQKYLPGLSEFANRVKATGTRVGCQLFHAGRYCYSALTGRQPIAPSAVFSKFNFEMPREMSAEDVNQVVKNFGQAAVMAKKAGFDLVEIIGSAGYLISQFLSPLTNQRTDAYGGSLENRMRFGLDVVREVRNQIGTETAIMFRFAGNELLPGGTPREELQAFARELELAGVDAINVTGGWHESNIPQITMEVPPGTFVYLARQIKDVVTIPVVASNRINDPLQAERILAEGSADLITVARGLIADPYWPEKARTGRIEEIRKCIGCNQGCLDHVFEMKPVECLVNAQAGHEAEFDVRPTNERKRVLVIGGGPAGMEAARAASGRGHEVELWEKTNRMGGQLNLAAVPPGRQDILNLIKNLEKSLESSGVKVRLNKEATLEAVREFSPQAVIVATGAKPTVPPIPGIEKDIVIQAWDLLEHGLAIGKNVVVIGGGAIGCETALHIAAMGTISAEMARFLLIHHVETPDRIEELTCSGTKKVTLIEQRDGIGLDIGRSTRWGMLASLKRYRIKTLSSTKVLAIDDDGVLVESGGNQTKIHADNVIIATGSISNDVMYKELQKYIQEIYIIGDAIRPRKALEAIHEGFKIGITI